MNKGQNRPRRRGPRRRVFEAGILASFGLLVGSDGDTDAYLERLPEYLDELGTIGGHLPRHRLPVPQDAVLRDGRA